jgi:hypothetical protein
MTADDRSHLEYRTACKNESGSEQVSRYHCLNFKNWLCI